MTNIQRQVLIITQTVAPHLQGMYVDRDSYCPLRHQYNDLLLGVEMKNQDIKNRLWGHTGKTFPLCGLCACDVSIFSGAIEQHEKRFHH